MKHNYAGQGLWLGQYTHIPNADVWAKEWLNDERVKWLILLGSGWIDWGSERFMVSTNVLIKEVWIAELSVAPGTESFVVPFSFVKKLMSNDSTHSGEESEKESELEVLSICLWFSLEPSIWEINLITDHDQGPYPWNGFNKSISV